MPLTILTTRPLPLPEMKLGGQHTNWLPFDGLAQDNDAPVLLATSLDRLDVNYIASLPISVKLIANLGVGVDHIDLVAAKARGIVVSNTPVVTEDTADLAFALILAACRKVGQNERFVRAGNWSADMPMASSGLRVHGRTLGLIGFGKIGKAVARRAQGFNMNIIYYTRHTKPGAYNGLTALASVDELIEASDIVSLHLPLSAETRHIINADRLRLFKSGAVLINTARGPLVDENALGAALKSGQIAAAGLDVFEKEPHINPTLLSCQSAVFTPHIGSATEACRRDMVACGLRNIDNFLRTGKPVDSVI